jgi:ATP-dependent DNA helicase PIF1
MKHTYYITIKIKKMEQVKQKLDVLGTVAGGLAYGCVIDTKQHIVITGSAGTGKTTLVNHIIKTIKKQCLVVATTGVAAKLVDAHTVHATFNLPNNFLLPGKDKKIDKVTKAIRETLQKIEVLIIEEASMLRADTLDSIDYILRKERNSTLPFGGVQMVFIGDMWQLGPVVTKQDKFMLMANYKSEYFFHAHAFKNIDVNVVELQEIYRQRDLGSTVLLNKVRKGETNDEDLIELNKRLAIPPIYTNYPIITTRNSIAAEINLEKLNALEGKAHEFNATIEGKWDSNLPNDKILTLKVGAKVCFIKNDFQGTFYNGLMGVIEKIDATKGVYIKTTQGEGWYGTVKWKNEVTVYEDDKVSRKIIGTFTQYPFKLAYAMTIHKSQGMTLDGYILDLGRDTLAPGQLYVALSRCRTLGRVYLTRRIRRTDVVTNAHVEEFMRNANNVDILKNIYWEIMPECNGMPLAPATEWIRKA